VTPLTWDVRHLPSGVHVRLSYGDASLPFALRAEDVTRERVEERIGVLSRYASAKTADCEVVDHWTVDALVCQMRAVAGAEVTDLL
jgi:hypothetical protein